MRTEKSRNPGILARGTNMQALLDELRALGPCRVAACTDAVPTLAALDPQAAPNYDRELGQRLVRAGAFVGAMTPFQLVEYLKGIVR